MPDQDPTQVVIFVPMTAAAAGNLNAILDQVPLKGAQNKALVAEVQVGILQAAEAADKGRENPPEASPALAEGDAAPPEGDSLPGVGTEGPEPQNQGVGYLGGD